MATAPVSRRLNLTRDQLATFLTDQQQIRQFELLLTAIDALSGQDVSAGQVYAGPTSGVGLPRFRLLQSSDIPASFLVDLLDVNITDVIDGQVLRYNSTSEKWENSVGFIVFENGDLLISNPSLEDTGRGITIDNLSGAVGYLAFTSPTSVTQLLVQDSGVVLASPEIELTSDSYFFVQAGGVRRLLLSGLNGFLSLAASDPPEPTAQLDISSDTIRLRNNRTPASATASGNRGDICWDTNYIYVCVNTNTWKRTAISTW